MTRMDAQRDSGAEQAPVESEPPAGAAQVASVGTDEWPTLDKLGREYVARVLAHTKGNISWAARILGIDRRSLYRWKAVLEGGRPRMLLRPRSNRELRRMQKVELLIDPGITGEVRELIIKEFKRIFVAPPAPDDPV